MSNNPTWPATCLNKRCPAHDANAASGCKSRSVYMADLCLEFKKSLDIPRTDEEILAQTNQLASTLYALRGYKSAPGYRFDKATHPHEIEAWIGACEAQVLLTSTDPRDIDDEE